MNITLQKAPFALLLAGLGSCSDIAGPHQPVGRLLAAASLALEWSADGSEIFYYDSGYTHTRIQPLPDRILAVNVATRTTRVVVASGAYGFAGYLGIAPHGIPPRVTIAGLAYLRIVGEGFALSVVTDTGDVVLAGSGPWFTVTPDRTRLLYSPPVWAPFDDSVRIIDLATGARTSVPTGPYHPTIGKTISPDGTRMLVARQDAQAGFGILDLSSATITVLHDSLFPEPTHFPPIPLGWNTDGVWFVQYGGPPHLIRYDPATGVGVRFAIADASSGTRAVTGGAILPLGNSFVWSQNCNSIDELSGICTQANYTVWLMNPLTGLDERLVDAYMMPDIDFPRTVFAAPSPNGQTLAYILGNELRLLALP